MRLGSRIVSVALCLAASQAQAQSIDGLLSNVTDTLSDVTDVLIPGITNIRVGIGPVFSPAYEGSDDYNIKAAPLISLRYRDLVQVDNNQIRVNVFGSDSLFRSENFRAGPLVNIDFGRDESDSLDLAGLGDVGTSIELGLFASYSMGPARLRVRGRQDIASGHSGLTITTDLGVAIYRSERLAVTGSISTTWADGNYMDSYFGVTTVQSASSGLATFDATSTFKDISLAFGGNFAMSSQWALVGNIGYSKLLGDAKNSPIVAIQETPTIDQGVGSSNQFLGGLWAVYSF